MYRVYIWFLGIQEDRVAGPWWSKELPSTIACHLFLSDCYQFLYAYSIVHESDWDNKEYFIKPPKNAKIVYPNKTTDKWEKV
jgi:hypothetical protein